MKWQNIESIHTYFLHLLQFNDLLSYLCTINMLLGTAIYHSYRCDIWDTT